MRYSTLALLICTTVGGSLHAQNTVGLLTNEAAFSQDGYTLFYPADQRVVYLVDNCGRLVHTWSDETYTPGNAAYLMENGDLVRCGKSDGEPNPVIGRGGAGEMVDRRDWDGNVIWRYTYNSQTYRMHHDVAMMPNGNVLIVAWELKTLEEAAALGLDTVGFEPTSVWPDHVIEVQPEGIDMGQIVWEWHAWDHLIQDRFPELPNYGVVAEHPERININYYPVVDADWMHINSIDYDPELDQILLTSPFLDELWVIDHSTTTEEAASSTGGNSGRGGDLLYRWGNPRAYDRGSLADRTLFFPHHARWLGPGLSPNDPDRGNIIVFNNRVGGNYSAVDLFEPPLEGTDYVIDGSSPYGPEAHYRRITAPDTLSMFSSGLSSAQKMPNGNVVICSGRQGWIFEMDAEDNLVWEYLIPLLSGVPVSQGTEIDGPGVFMALKYPTDHPFLSQQDLPTDQYIELEPDTVFCGSINVAVSESDRASSPLMHPNPAANTLAIATRPGQVIRIIDMLGQIVASQPATADLTRMDLSPIAAGTYLVQVNGDRGQLLVIER